MPIERQGNELKTREPEHRQHLHCDTNVVAAICPLPGNKQKATNTGVCGNEGEHARLGLCRH